MRSFVTAASEWFWSERVWWPPGYGWHSLKSRPEEPYPEYADLYRPILLAFLLIPLRWAFQTYVARPFGKALGIKERARISALDSLIAKLKNFLVAQPELTKRVATNGYANGSTPKAATASSSTPASLSHRLRFALKKSKLDKFSECMWRATAYFALWTYGFAAIYDKSWVWNSTEMWVAYPRIPLDPSIWWLYQAEATFYWNLMISQFFDTQIQRKDFVMNFVHHVAALALIWFSWSINYVQVGALVMVIHDICDPFLELAKTGRYMGRPDVCNFFFVIFAGLWVVTRLMIYPYRLLYSTLVEAPAFIQWYPVYYIFNFFLLTLFVLHLLWSHMILKIIIKALGDGEADDTRSEADSDSEEEEDPHED